MDIYATRIDDLMLAQEVSDSTATAMGRRAPSCSCRPGLTEEQTHHAADSDQILERDRGPI